MACASSPLNALSAASVETRFTAVTSATVLAPARVTHSTMMQLIASDRSFNPQPKTHAPLRTPASRSRTARHYRAPIRTTVRSFIDLRHSSWQPTQGIRATHHRLGGVQQRGSGIPLTNSTHKKRGPATFLHIMASFVTKLTNSNGQMTALIHPTSGYFGGFATVDDEDKHNR